MPRPEKVAAVEEIKTRIESAEAVFLTEYRGLSVPDQQELRGALREVGAEFKVVKMSLARLAAAELGLDDLAADMLGPTAIAFTDTDPVPTAKALKDFAGQHEVFVLKSGLMSGAVLTPEAVIKLAEIEPIDVLLSKIAGAAKAPLYKTATLLTAMLRNSASAFSQLLEKKEQEAPAAPESVEGEEPKADGAGDTGEDDASGDGEDDADSSDSVESPESVDSPDSPDSVDSPDGDDADEAPEAAADDSVEADSAEEPSAEADEAPEASDDSETEPESESDEAPAESDDSETDNDGDAEDDSDSDDKE